MATLNWESENRRKNLARWIRQNELNPFWWEKDPVYEQDLEVWAKRQAARVVAKVGNHAKATPLLTTLDHLNEAIQCSDLEGMKKYAEKALNENTIRSGTTNEERTNLSMLIQMVLCISE